MIVAATAVSLALTMCGPVAANGGDSSPLIPVIKRIITGQAGEQPAWKLLLLLQGLGASPLTSKCTTYCELDHDGGGSHTRWGTHVRRGICAADPRYWGPGSVVYVGAPVDEVLIVEDTGSAIKGPDRFDICVTGHHDLCNRWGCFNTPYVPLYRAPVRGSWSDKPAAWHPPVPSLTRELLRLATERAPCLRPLLLPLVAEGKGADAG
jgi:3D (Asp-Asp-Asp) domain-containing protein